MAQSKNVRMPLNAGATPDGFSETVQVEDTNNVVFLPDGSAMQPRNGYEIRRRDEVGFGSDRKVIYFIADPPDVDYGDMICLVNTKDGRNDVQMTEIVRTTVTKSAENPMPMPDLTISTLSFDSADGTVNFGAGFNVSVIATGDGGTTGWEAYSIESYGSGGSTQTLIDSGNVSATVGSPGSIALTAPAHNPSATDQYVYVYLVPPVTSGVDYGIDFKNYTLTGA